MRHPALRDHLRWNGAVVECLPVVHHSIDVEQEPGLGKVTEEGPVHRGNHQMGHAHPHRTHEVAAQTHVGELVGHDLPQELANAGPGLGLVVENVVSSGWPSATSLQV